MATDRVKVAVVSMSGQQASYAPAFHENPKAEIVAVTEDGNPDAETVQKNRDGAKQFGVPYIEDLDDVLAMDDVQAVTMCGDPDDRAGLTERIASAGKHILADKPLTNTLADGDAIIDSVERHGIKMMVGHNSRFNPQVLQTREALKAGEVGLPWSINSEMVIAAGKKAADIGEVRNHVMYPLDTMLYLVPEKVRTVYCVSGAFFFDNARENGVEDLAFITMNMDRGIIASTSIGRTPHDHINGYGGDRTLEVLGTHGWIFLDHSRPSWRTYGKTGTRSLPFQANFLSDMVDHFLESIINDTTPMCSPQDARDTLEITLAALKSAETGLVVKLPFKEE